MMKIRDTALILAVLTLAAAAPRADAMGRRPPKDQPIADTAAAVDTGAVDTAAVAASVELARHPSEIRFDTLDWKVPLGEPYRVRLANGPIAYVAADSSLPLVTVEAYVRSGSLTDPAGKEGLGALMARLLRSGGTELYRADTLDALIDLLAMSVSFSQGEAGMTLRASFLAEYADTALQIMRQMFFYPAFEQKRIDTERSIMAEGVSHRFANPGPTLGVAYRKHVYPKYAPARLVTEASLKSIRRVDLVALHKSAFGASDIIVSAAGKFDRGEMIRKLNAVFIVPINPRDAQIPDIAVAPRTRALVVHKPINQVYIRMGLPLFKRPHPDYYAVSLLNYILGGSGFTSRLGARVRSDEGLTYSIYSYAESNYTYQGTFHADFYTKTESYLRAASIALEELEKAVRDGVTAEELENAKTALIAELPSSFRRPEDIVSTYAWNEFYGRAPDHYAKYPDELRRLTLDDIKNAAKKYIAVDRITYTIVGDTAAMNAAGAAAKGGEASVLKALEDRKTVVADSLVSMP